MDPGEEPGGPGPPLIFGQNWGPKGRKICFFKTAPPPLSQSLDDRSPPHLSEGRDPPLILFFQKRYQFFYSPAHWWLLLLSLSQEEGIIMFYEKVKKDISELCCDIIVYPISFCMASKLKCILSLRKKRSTLLQLFFAFIFPLMSLRRF